MEFKEYQKGALTTAGHPKKYNVIYPAMGLGNEAGEVLGKIKKWLRGDDGNGKMSKERKQALKEELGDVLFTIVNLARWYKLDPEENLNNGITKFIRRFHRVEKRVNKSGKKINNLTPKELDKLWKEVKKGEKETRKE